MRFGHALLELIDAPGGIYKFLLASVEGVAHVANANDDYRLGGACLDHIAARATNLRIQVFRMYVNFHKRPEKIPSRVGMTSRKFGNLIAREDINF